MASWSLAAMIIAEVIAGSPAHEPSLLALKCGVLDQLVVGHWWGAPVCLQQCRELPRPQLQTPQGSNLGGGGMSRGPIHDFNDVLSGANRCACLARGVL
jgi:hypothetical protein